MTNHNAEGPHADDDQQHATNNPYAGVPYIEDEEWLGHSYEEVEDPPLWRDADGLTIEDDPPEGYDDEDDHDDAGHHPAPPSAPAPACRPYSGPTIAQIENAKNKRLDFSAPPPDPEPVLSEAEREEKWTSYMRDAKPIDLPGEARSRVHDKIIEQNRYSGRKHGQYLTPSITRSDANGFYVGTYENFRLQYFSDWDHSDKATDDQILTQLYETQPHRVPCSLDFHGKQPIPTYGPLMFTQSADPVAAAPHQPPPEPRPAQWSPEATPAEITAGVARELLDCAALYVARIKVATGHRPDSQSIDQLHKLSQVLRNAQRITKAATPKKRRCSPGAPHKRSLPNTLKVTTLKIEIAEKNKIYAPKKKRSLTQAKSVRKVELNSDIANLPLTPIESDLKVKLNSSAK